MKQVPFIEWNIKRNIKRIIKGNTDRKSYRNLCIEAKLQIIEFKNVNNLINKIHEIISNYWQEKKK